MLRLDTEAKQKRFLSQAMRRANHHALGVANITPIVIRAIFDKADSGSIVANQYRGKLTASGWFSLAGRRFWAGYNHKEGQIEVRYGNRRGETFAYFNDDNSSEAGVRRLIRLAKRRAAAA